jgi:hypothetical protein
MLNAIVLAAISIMLSQGPPTRPVRVTPTVDGAAISVAGRPTWTVDCSPSDRGKVCHLIHTSVSAADGAPHVVLAADAPGLVCVAVPTNAMFRRAAFRIDDRPLLITDDNGCYRLRLVSRELRDGRRWYSRWFVQGSPTPVEVAFDLVGIAEALGELDRLSP